MTQFIKNQRGALFGIDARIMLAIFSGLAVVTGMSMGGVLSGSKATGLSKDVEVYRNAVESIQHDLRSNIHAFSGSNSSKNFIALFNKDTAYLNTARQALWMGPYIEEHSVVSNVAQHRFFGNLGLHYKKTNGTTNCSASDRSPCYYWLTISDVPYSIVEKYNNLVDGEGESSAQTKGAVIWTGTGPHTLWTRLTVALKN